LSSENQTGMINRWGICICILFMILAIFVQSHILIPYTNDDSYISLRYAKNCADGNGLVYNPGDRVEGYSNFLWVLLEALLFKSGMDAESGIKLAGFILAVFTVCLLWLRPAGKTAYIFVGTLLVFQSSFWLWSWAGLETPLFTFLMLAAVLRFRDELSQSKKFPLSAIAFFFLSITRPEGILFVLVSGIFIVFKYGFRNIITRGPIFWYLISFGGYLIYWVLRYQYYGYPFPNSFYVKTGGGIPQYIQGLHYLNFFFWSEGYYPLIIISLVIYLIRIRSAALQFHYIPALLAMQFVFIVYAGGDQFPFFRFMVPVSPILYVFYIEQILVTDIEHVSIHKNSFRSKFHLKGIVLQVLVMTFAFIWWLTMTVDQKNYWIKRGFNLVQYQETIRTEILIPTAEYLKAKTTGKEVIAVGWAGTIPYYSGLKTIDMLGINDTHIAHRELPWDERFFGHVKHDVPYVLSLKPDYVIMSFPRSVLFKGDPVYLLSDRLMMDSDSFQKNYRLLIPSITGKEDLEFAVFQRVAE